jgi:hypothetical protein
MADGPVRRDLPLVVARLVGIMADHMTPDGLRSAASELREAQGPLDEHARQFLEDAALALSAIATRQETSLQETALPPDLSDSLE